jgi:hypothetical protein
MKQVSEMPTSGQFVAVWTSVRSQISEQSINCKRFQWFNGNLKEMQSDIMFAIDDANKMKEILDSMDAIYFVID